MKPNEVFTFVIKCRQLGLPAPITEYKFHPIRKWRADFAWPDKHLLVECEGGVFVRGRHSRGAGMIKDMEKYNAATAMGYRVLRYTPATFNYEQIAEVYNGHHTVN